MTDINKLEKLAKATLTCATKQHDVNFAIEVSASTILAIISKYRRMEEALREASQCIESLGKEGGGWAWEETMQTIQDALQDQDQ